MACGAGCRRSECRDQPAPRQPAWRWGQGRLHRQGCPLRHQAAAVRHQWSGQSRQPHEGVARHIHGLQKAFPGTVRYPSMQILLRRERNRMQQEIQPFPALCEGLEQYLQLRVVDCIQRHLGGHTQWLGQWFDMRARARCARSRSIRCHGSGSPGHIPRRRCVRPQCPRPILSCLPDCPRSFFFHVFARCIAEYLVTADGRTHARR